MIDHDRMLKFLLTLSQARRNNVRSLYFHPGPRIVDLCEKIFDTSSSLHKGQMLLWMTYYSKTDKRAQKMAEACLESKSAELVHWAMRLFSYCQIDSIVPKIEAMTSDKREKVRVDAVHALKAIKNRNHQDFIPPYQWAPSVMTHWLVEKYKSGEYNYKEAVDTFIVKLLKPHELEELKSIIGDIYKIYE